MTLTLPNFLIAGATRSGTTTLYDALNKNPNLFLPREKEPHFFDYDINYNKGLEAYAEYFREAPKGTICGEATANYFSHGNIMDENQSYKYTPENDSAVRIKEVLPNVKIILSLRHPVMRAYSFFGRTKWQGHEKATTFEQAVEEELNGMRSKEDTIICPLYLSHYKIHLEHWLKYFSPDQILVLIMEEWSAKPAEAIRTIEDFLEVPPSHLKDADIQKTNGGRHVSKFWGPITRIAPTSKLMRVAARKLFSKSGYEQINPETYKRLSTLFEDDIKYIESFLGRNIDSWRNMSI